MSHTWHKTKIRAKNCPTMLHPFFLYKSDNRISCVVCVCVCVFFFFFFSYRLVDMLWNAMCVLHSYTFLNARKSRYATICGSRPYLLLHTINPNRFFRCLKKVIVLHACAVWGLHMLPNVWHGAYAPLLLRYVYERYLNSTGEGTSSLLSLYHKTLTIW